MLNKKIALLITGGTIGMHTVAGESRIPDNSQDYNAINNWHDWYDLDDLNDDKPSDVSIDSYVLCYKDSSSMGVKDWQLIIHKIHDLADKYDGFIVSHGTDTMAYSAAAVAYHFGKDLPFPIVFTGSCRSHDMPDTDAWRNLRDSVAAACSDLGEVAIVFAGKVRRASRALKIFSATDDIFTTPQVEPVAEVHSGVLNIHSHCKRCTVDAPLPHNQSTFSDKLMFINSMPALDSSTLASIAQNSSWEIGLIQGLGAGNLTDELIDFIDASVRVKKHLVIAPASEVSFIYPPLKNALEAGSILAEGYSICSLWVKLSWLLGQLGEQHQQSSSTTMDYCQQSNFLRNSLKTNFVNEIL